MSIPNHSEKSVYLDREEHAHKGAVGAKNTVLYTYNSGTDTLVPVNSDNPVPTSSNISQYGGATTTLGQKTSAASIPVVLPSDQTISVNSTGLAVTEAIVATAYNLASAAYSVVSALSNDYQLDTITFQFSTTQSRTITVTRESDGSKVWEDTNTSLEITLEQIDEVFDSADQFRIAITQTGGACTVDISAKVLEGSVTLTGNPSVSQESPFNVRSMSRFYNIRGQRYLNTTGYVTQTANTAGELIAMFRNPSGSGQYVVFDKAEFGSTADTRFSRFGGGTVALIGTPTARPIGRTDGGASTSVMELYTAGKTSPQFSVSVEGTLRKVATMQAYQQYQLLEMDGTAVVQPGQVIYWRVDEPAGGGGTDYHTLIDLEWVEIPTATWTAMVTALQAEATY